MGIGNKIKEYRTEKGLTQKALAEQLNVSFQAVSRWENEDVEPSFDCVKQMAEIFGCSIDDLFGMEKKAVEPAPEKVVEKVIIKEEAKPVLGVCEICNKPIYDADQIVRFNTYSGRGFNAATIPHVSCKACNDAKVARERAAVKKKNKKIFVRSIVFPTLILIAFIVVSVFLFRLSTVVGLGVLALGLLSFCFTACMILDNTFLPNMWLEVATWGFVSMPGVIFEFSLDGCLVGIAIKIALAVLSFILALLSIAFATVLALALSIFVYPFALRKIIKDLKA